MKECVIQAKCDFCDKQATTDSKLIYGSWGYTCDDCYKIHSLKIKELTTKLVEKPII